MALLIIVLNQKALTGTVLGNYIWSRTREHLWTLVPVLQKRESSLDTLHRDTRSDVL